MSTFKKTSFVPKISAAETRYNFLVRKLRKIRDLTKQTQQEIAWLFKEITDYGFNFFPNHYLWNNLDKLEAILNEQTAKQGA
ncbi:hypothetical protein [Alishewanella phage vB_AspM_Slickus01]|nr:hypothetical protein [Alishewanella phage vB_AspM_Slickus01]